MTLFRHSTFGGLLAVPSPNWAANRRSSSSTLPPRVYDEGRFVQQPRTDHPPVELVVEKPIAAAVGSDTVRAPVTKHG